MSKSLRDRLRELDQEQKPGDIHRRLERVYRQGNRNKTFPDETVIRDARGIHEFVDGNYENTSFGDVFVARQHYPWNYEHGNQTPEIINSIAGNWLNRLGNFSDQSDFDVGKTLFIDTETTGLAGGSGTLAFMIGIGFIEQDGFTVQQYFADAFNCEEGMLDLVADFVEPYTTIVSFNGKTYDLPLLSTRYILKRRTSPFDGLDHLDLLHIARQIWGYQLDNCRLQTIEQEVLDFKRAEDLPGSAVPQAYFKFLQGRGADPLYRVFEHNAHDILTLGILLPLVWEITRPDSQAGNLQLSRSKILLRHGERTAARQALEIFIAAEKYGQLKQRGCLELARIYKQDGLWDEACHFWKAVISTSKVFFLEPYVELAKFYEHKNRDWDQALELTLAGISGLSTGRDREMRELIHRKTRLKTKIRRKL
ncbi:MAG: ribonuclease H-like domain-containing protein [Candidatus Marinimicrobia bacterium]|nr:ribonuclease H-like domain-containing protein [Candidatus Neomarinimicrobiota bacterium]